MHEIYKLTLSQLSGLLTDLQSDTVFGHLCWRMKEIYGDDILNEFLNLYKNNNPVFTISDNLFEKENKVYFPKPIYSISLNKDKTDLIKAEKLKLMCEYKQIKNVKFIDTETLNLFLKGDIDEYYKKLLNSENIKTFDDSLRTNVQINRETLSAMEGRLFSYSPKYLNSNFEKNEQKVNICFLIKKFNEQEFEYFHCEELLKEVFDTGFGKKKSSGYGQFKVEGGLTEYDKIHEPNNSNGFLNLSNYLPSNEDGITDYYYDYHVKYGKLGEQYAQSENPFKKPIIFFKPGSCFKTKDPKDWYGRCTNEKEISDYKEVIQNGCAFTLKAKIG
ncbi:MAG TPA: hypothetical protein DCY06_00115 [Bacteroidetes bacterium]|nr:hypothetical protein [Bacteroidota bacterium]